MMTRLLFITLCSAALFALSCNKEQIEKDKTSYEVNLNPKSPHILKVKKEDGVIINYYGLKDEAGKTRQIQSVSIKRPEEINPSLLQFTPDKRLGRILASDGSMYRFDWTGATTFRLIAVSANRSQQVSIPVDLNDFRFQSPGSTGSSVKGKNPLPTKQTSSRINRKTDFTVKPLPLAAHINNAIDFRGGNRDMNLIITRCGQSIPVDDWAPLPLNVDFCSPCKNDGILFPDGVSNRYILPESGPGLVANLADICNSISSGLSDVCTILEPILLIPGAIEYICGQLQLVTPLGTFVFCEGFFRGMNLACLFASGPVVGSPSLTDVFCDIVRGFSSDFRPTTIKLSPWGGTPGNNFLLELPYDGPFGNQYVDIPGNMPTISDLRTNPIDPVPEEDYIATATIHCAAGELVRISVIGTDGYEDENVFIAQGGITVSLRVPGALGGVKDVITVEVDGGARLVTSIIF